MASHRESRVRNARRWRGAALILAGMWLALLLGIGLAGMSNLDSVVAFAKPINTSIVPTVTITPPTVDLTPSPTDTSTPTTPTASATAGTPTGTVTATVTGTVTATATSGSTDTGNTNYGDPSSSAEPTKVVFAQPTSGSHDDGPLQGLTPGAFTSNGLLLATTMSCIVTVLGVIVVAVAMSSLLRGGYGPFLRALVLGKRAGSGGKVGAGKANKSKSAQPDPADSRDDWALSEELGALSESYQVPARGRADFGGRRSGPPQARSPRQPPPSRRGDRW